MQTAFGQNRNKAKSNRNFACLLFREMTVLIEASVHVGTFSGVVTDKLRGQLIPLSVYRRKTQWFSAAAESRPKVRSWPSAKTERLPKQYTSLLSALKPKPNFGWSLCIASIVVVYIFCLPFCLFQSF